MSTTPDYQSGETPWLRLKTLTRAVGGTVVTTLDPGESIAYEIMDATGDVVGSGDSTSEVTYQTFIINGESVGAWSALAVQDPSGDPLDVGRYAVRWTLDIGGGVAIEDDALRIKA
jgi:hypothetical protein